MSGTTITKTEKELRKTVDNFAEIEPTLDFKKNTFYKFMIVVRNKDGRTPLVAKEAPSGETTIKQWYIESEEYYNKVKSEMVGLADATRGRLYMCIERKSSYKMFMLLLDKVTAIIKEAIICPNATPKRLNKIVNSITSDKLCTDEGCKTWMYDIDDEDEYGWYRDAILAYIAMVGNIGTDEIRVLQSRSGWHIIVPRKYAIDENWHRWVADRVIEFAKITKPKLTIEDCTDIIHVVEDIKVQPNQMCLVYYNEVK